MQLVELARWLKPPSPMLRPALPTWPLLVFMGSKPHNPKVCRTGSHKPLELLLTTQHPLNKNKVGHPAHWQTILRRGRPTRSNTACKNVYPYGWRNANSHATGHRSSSRYANSFCYCPSRTRDPIPQEAHTSALANAGMALFAHFGGDPNSASPEQINSFHSQLMNGIGGTTASPGATALSQSAAPSTRGASKDAVRRRGARGSE